MNLSPQTQRELVELVERIQWGDHDETEAAICPVCANPRHFIRGGKSLHRDDCALSKLLAKARAEMGTDNG